MANYATAFARVGLSYSEIESLKVSTNPISTSPDIENDSTEAKHRSLITEGQFEHYEELNVIPDELFYI